MMPSSPVAELALLRVTLSEGPCSRCKAIGRGVTFNAAAGGEGLRLAADFELARVGVGCGCFDSILRLIGDCLVCPD